METQRHDWGWQDMEHSTGEPATIDWGQSLRLGAVASALAALVAIALAGHVAETTIVVSVIVLATMASWFQIEQPSAGTPRRAHATASPNGHPGTR